jgi:lysozyme
MKTSDNGIELIKRFEGLRLKAYLCPAGKPTIGYGHTEGVKPGQTITEEEAEQLLREDLIVVENEINKHNLDINQNQFDALASFVYNVGVGNFRTSTLLKKIKADPNDKTIANEFKRWVYSNGKKLPGLVKRREEEAKLYFLN